MGAGRACQNRVLWSLDGRRCCQFHTTSCWTLATPHELDSSLGEWVTSWKGLHNRGYLLQQRGQCTSSPALTEAISWNLGLASRNLLAISEVQANGSFVTTIQTLRIKSLGGVNPSDHRFGINSTTMSQCRLAETARMLKGTLQFSFHYVRNLEWLVANGWDDVSCYARCTQVGQVKQTLSQGRYSRRDTTSSWINDRGKIWWSKVLRS